MKKIVTVVAAIAMAASMFAVDIAANIHGWTDLFKMEFKDGAKPSYLGVRDPFDRKFAWSSTGIGISVNADKAGASFELNGRSAAVEFAKIYVQPVDMLKITVGDMSLTANAETIDYTKLTAFEHLEGWGFDLTPVAGLTINTIFAAGEARNWAWKFWGNGKDIGETVAKISYGADFGTISALYDYNAKVHSITGAYAGAFGGVNMFVDVAYTAAKDANVLGADAFVGGNADAFGYKAYVKYNRGLDAKTNELLLKARLAYAFDGFNGYCKVYVPNAMADEFPIVVYPGVEFNIGSASIDAGVQFCWNADADCAAAAGSKFISVPVVYKLSF